MPSLFSKIYPDLVCIIDCTEIFMECLSGLNNQSVCYSQYKSHNTMKGLIGITQSGVISFVSDLHTCSFTDPDINWKNLDISIILKRAIGYWQSEYQIWLTFM